MASKIPQIRVFSPQEKRKVEKQTTRFNWHTAVNTSGNLSQHFKNESQRFFGSTTSSGLSTGKLKSLTSIKRETVKWDNAFNMRAQNLANFPCNANNYRITYRSQAVAMQRVRAGFVSGTAKSLDLLRQNLQKSINKEIDEIIQKYVDKFFKLGIENIKVNNGENTVSDHHVQAVCQQILEEAKKMYQGTILRGNSPTRESLDTESNVAESKLQKPVLKISRKRKDSDTDSEICSVILKPKKKKGRPALNAHGNASGRSTPMKIKADQIKREGPKWDSSRLTSETKFMMGAKANKALGLGATRGRLYIKHPEIFKYSGDQEDKQWLYDQSLMPATGGKAYMLLMEDIKELADSDEYKHNPALRVDDIVGFNIPDKMLQKMKTTMQQMRTDVPVKKRRKGPAPNIDSSIENIPKTEDTTFECNEEKRDDSGTVTPTDELDILSTGLTSTDPSPFSLGTGFDDVSPAQADMSPSPSDVSTTLEPSLTSAFEINSTP